MAQQEAVCLGVHFAAVEALAWPRIDIVLRLNADRWAGLMRLIMSALYYHCRMPKYINCCIALQFKMGNDSVFLLPQ